MKKNIFFSIFCLAVLGWLILSGCKVTEIEAGIGTIRLMNNSTNVIIVYWAAERGGNTVRESRTQINPGASATISIDTGSTYDIYLEDQFGDGWETRSWVRVRKDETVQVSFPSDFKVSN